MLHEAKCTLVTKDDNNLGVEASSGESMQQGSEAGDNGDKGREGVDGRSVNGKGCGWGCPWCDGWPWKVTMVLMEVAPKGKMEWEV